MTFYIARVTNHYGETIVFDSRHYALKGDSKTPGPKVMTRRIARTYGRALARHCGLRGRLTTRVQRCGSATGITGNVADALAETYAKVAEVFAIGAKEFGDTLTERVVSKPATLAAPYGEEFRDYCTQDVENEKGAPISSIFPAKVVRVADDPNYSRPRFHVRDANDRTIRNCKTKREADALAERINVYEKDREENKAADSGNV